MVIDPPLRVLLIWAGMTLVSWAVVGWIVAEQWNSIWMIILMIVNLLPAGIFYDRPPAFKRAFPSPL